MQNGLITDWGKKQNNISDQSNLIIFIGKRNLKKKKKNALVNRRKNSIFFFENSKFNYNLIFINF